MNYILLSDEYNLYACKGNTLENKINDYLNSISYISEKYK